MKFDKNSLMLVLILALLFLLFSANMKPKMEGMRGKDTTEYCCGI